MLGREYEIYLLCKKMVLLVCRLLGNFLNCKGFLRRLEILFYNFGDKEFISSMYFILRGGFYFVVDNKLIVFFLLYFKY